MSGGPLEAPRPSSPTIADFIRESSLADISLGPGPSAENPLVTFARMAVGASPPPAPPRPPAIKDRWFKEQTIKIDGYVFERCRFDGCRLVTEYGSFVFRDCFVSPNSQIFFQGPALKVARLVLHQLAQRGRIQIAAGEEGMFPTSKPDGTFSLE